MHRLTTDMLGEHDGTSYFLTVAVEPTPSEFERSDPYEDAIEWCVTIHYPGSLPNESDTQVARMDTRHGQPHFDRLFEPDQPKEWLPPDFTLADAETILASRWREYAQTFHRNHVPGD